MLDSSSIVFKIIVLGHQGVGKSSMLIRYIKGSFSPQYIVTLGVEFSSKSVQIDQKNIVKLQIWDTAGQQTFRAIVRSFYKGIAGVFLVYGIDNMQSFQSLKNWLKEVRQNAHQQVVFFLVGTRADLESNRKVTPQKANEFLKEIGGVFFIETSAKLGTNVEELFQRTAKIMYKKYVSNQSFRNLVRPVLAQGFSAERRDSFTIGDNRNSKVPTKKNCC